MSKTRPKPPKESRAEVLDDLMELLKNYREAGYDTHIYLTSFLTTIDLVGIRDDLRSQL